MSIARWIYVFGAVVLDGCAALVAGLLPERWLERHQEQMVGFAAGVLLATTFLDLLPEALRQLSIGPTLSLVLASLTAMVVLESTVGHRGKHGKGRHRARGFAAVLLGADAFHNTADGAAIAAAFLASTRLGVLTAAAVIIHEVPEEMADYVLLRRNGMPRARALFAMAGVQLTAALGATATLIGATAWRPISAAALAVAAGTFLHIAEVDLVPTVLEPVGPRQRRTNALIAFLLGIAFVVAESLA